MCQGKLWWLEHEVLLFGSPSIYVGVCHDCGHHIKTNEMGRLRGFLNYRYGYRISCKKERKRERKRTAKMGKTVELERRSCHYTVLHNTIVNLLYIVRNSYLVEELAVLSYVYFLRDSDFRMNECGAPMHTWANNCPQLGWH